MRAKTVLKHTLLIFVWISVGYAVGKHATLRTVHSAAPPEGAPAASADAPDYRVWVHYLHGNLRCVTCNSIEAMTKQTVEEEFAEALADGTVVWNTANFQRDPELGRRYDVAGSTVVVALEEHGEEVGYRILDEVWVLVNSEDQFRQFMREVIREYLDAGAGA